MLVSTTSTSSRTRSAILRTAHPFCASPRFQVVLSSCTTTSSHQKLEVGRTTGKSWFSKVNSDRLMQFLFVSSLSLSSWTFLILCFMQNTAFDQTNAIFPTQFYKLVLGVIANIESWENDFEYEYGLKLFSYSYSLLMLTSSIDTHEVSYPNITTQRILLENQADWFICQVQLVVKACSRFYAWISSLLT